MTQHTLDWEKSKAVFDDCQALIKPKQCYHNIYQIMNSFDYFEKFKAGEWQIAYGYVQITQELYARHCFIVDENCNAIDPTLALTHPEGFKELPYYFAFAILSPTEWFELLEKNQYDISLGYAFRESEPNAYEYAKKHGMLLIG